ncbi:hypothetical protein [Sphingobacterium siyangense]|uniref:hypothetical protein n=1 Tax=Sphingobacterium siyangense TaxID=459529 RepID=UPI003C750DC9
MKIKVTQYYSLLCLGTVLLSPLFSNGQVKSLGNGPESGSEISQLNFTINSPLLADVDRQIQDSVIETIKMDTNHNIEHHENTIQTIKYGLSPIDFPSLLFVPVLLS